MRKRKGRKGKGEKEEGRGEGEERYYLERFCKQVFKGK